MESITVDAFVKEFLKSNPNTKEADIRKKLNVAIKAKQAHKTCINCGSNIWAIGTALSGWNGCFSCITGEANHDEDYEIDTVNI